MFRLQSRTGIQSPEEFEKQYRPGSPIFTFVKSSGAMHKLHTVADIPTLNWLLVERERLGHRVPNDTGLYPTSNIPTYEMVDNILSTTENDKS